MTVSIIACVDTYGGISRDGTIPWIRADGTNKYPADFKHFNKITKGNICVMGRHTYNEIVSIAEKRRKNGKKLKRVLPGRQCVVLSHNQSSFQYADSSNNLRDVLDTNTGKTVFVIGGEKLFIESLTLATDVYLTVLDTSYSCDRFFPVDFVHRHFKIIHGEQKDGLCFVHYQRGGK